MDGQAQEDPVAAGELLRDIFPSHASCAAPACNSLLTQPAWLHLELMVWFGVRQ